MGELNTQEIIKPKKKITPKIYAYITPNNLDNEGWVKIGYTKQDSVEQRIKQQTHTARTKTEKLWDHVARFNDGNYFTDREFHTYLTKNNIERADGYEWFYFGVGNEFQSEKMFMEFTFKKYDDLQKTLQMTYVLRDEQEEAVQTAYDYAVNNPGGEFLWNAKPRFGKTLSAYDLVRKLNAEKVLIVTNRPAIANSWFDDFEKFIAWQTDYKFVSESASLKDRNPMTRTEFGMYASQNENAKRIDFISLQDLKGSWYHGGRHDKLDWVSELNWDILIIDEAHEGIDTYKTDIAFDQIKRNFTLHLSGTPFKAIATGKFSENQIYNWSYQDEQEAKEAWDDEKEELSPYAELPRLNMLTYQMSNMITDEINQGAIIEGVERDYAFDLNEFFATKDNGSFEHEDDVIRWLDSLTHNEKYPFSTPELRNELKHTFWILEYVASARALAKLLNKHPVFKEYRVVLAAGDGKIDDMDANEESLTKVKNAIEKYDKTITLSVGQLTTGVTIPEWSAVLMLSNMKSASLYMQAAFRAQNPHQWVETVDGKDVVYQKQNSYVFDFAPERTLIIFDEFANNLNPATSSGGGTSADREENIKRLLNFFPIIGEDIDGTMKELDFKDVLTIPRKIKATEVVRRGFMSNLLFANISGIFAAPQIVLDTLNELTPEKEGKLRPTKEEVDPGDVTLDDDGEAEIDVGAAINVSNAILGNKIYEVIKPNIPEKEKIDEIPKRKIVEDTTKSILDSIDLDEVMNKSREATNATIRETNRAKKKLENEVKREVERKIDESTIQRKVAEKDYKNQVSEAKSEEEVEQYNQEFNKKIDDIFTNLGQDIKEKTTEIIQESNREFIQEQARKVENKKRDTVIDDVRSRLRGFARTIPSFIMAYGEEDLTLANFDTYVPINVFKEVTGITIDQFKFLRDGGPYEEEGQEKHFKGRLFDEIVFNESVQEFLRKKSELSNYFEDHDEDIFDYIPPQETNQIYTPKKVVKMMVDTLEEENPGIYDDSSKTFIDIYMKSGLYITKIVKKLYNSNVIKREIPNDEQRIKHILENQVYGFAPTEIIYNIAVNFIFGELDNSISRKNFVHVDTTPYARTGTLQELVNEKFGK